MLNLKLKISLFALSVLILSISSCGKKSKLYLPQEKRAVQFKNFIEGYNIKESENNFKFYSKNNQHNQKKITENKTEKEEEPAIKNSKNLPAKNNTKESEEKEGQKYNSENNNEQNW